MTKFEEVRPTEGLGQDYFERQAAIAKDRPILPLQATPCYDCAARDMYEGISYDLGLCPPELQLEVAQKWFCHINCGHACRGNANNLNLTWEV